MVPEGQSARPRRLVNTLRIKALSGSAPCPITGNRDHQSPTVLQCGTKSGAGTTGRLLHGPSPADLAFLPVHARIGVLPTAAPTGLRDRRCHPVSPSWGLMSFMRSPDFA